MSDTPQNFYIVFSTLNNMFKSTDWTSPETEWTEFLTSNANIHAESELPYADGKPPKEIVFIPLGSHVVKPNIEQARTIFLQSQLENK